MYRSKAYKENWHSFFTSRFYKNKKYSNKTWKTTFRKKVKGVLEEVEKEWLKEKLKLRKT